MQCEAEHLYSVFTALHISEENSMDILGHLAQTIAVSILR
jgi:hypothetical protein